MFDRALNSTSKLVRHNYKNNLNFSLQWIYHCIEYEKKKSNKLNPNHRPEIKIQNQIIFLASFIY